MDHRAVSGESRSIVQQRQAPRNRLVASQQAAKDAFAALTEHDLLALQAHSRRARYRKGEPVRALHREDDSTFIIADGCVRLHRCTLAGHEVTLHCLHPGDVFGLPPLRHGVPGQCIATIQSDTADILHIGFPQLQEMVRAVPAVAAYVLSQLHERLREAQDQIEELTAHTGKERLAHKLAQLAQSGDGHHVGETHAALGAWVGMRQNDVTKTLADFKARGLISYRRHRHGIVVLDVESLLSM